MSGLVLAGGRSSRLGRDKVREEVGGKPLLLRTVDAVAFATDEVLLAGDPTGREDLALPADARWVPDIVPGRGPLSGLQAGLAAARHEFVLMVGCDMPFLNPSVLRFLIGLAPGHEAVVPRIRGQMEPLHAVYARSNLPIVEALLAKNDGTSRPQDLIARVRVRYVGEEELRSLDPDLRSFFNVNTEEDLARARRMLGPASPAY